MLVEFKNEAVVAIGGVFGVGMNVLGVILGKISFVDDLHALAMSLLSGAVGIAGAYGMQSLIKWIKEKRNANKAKRAARNSSVDGTEEIGAIHPDSE